MRPLAPLGPSPPVAFGRLPILRAQVMSLLATSLRRIPRPSGAARMARRCLGAARWRGRDVCGVGGMVGWDLFMGSRSLS